ncbi:MULTISPECIES: hypothetical protein [unclassified Acidovorax]|nr:MULTISPECIES: hypothetical protein [unclassified Acidovorax]
MGRQEAEGFLAMLANERRVAAGTHNQAGASRTLPGLDSCGMSALRFLSG